MDPIYAVLVVIGIGVLCWLALTYIPMAEPFPRIMIGVAVIATVLWLLCGFDLFCLSNHMRK
jgi:hypothetical protein